MFTAKHEADSSSLQKPAGPEGVGGATLFIFRYAPYSQEHVHSHIPVLVFFRLCLAVHFQHRRGVAALTHLTRGQEGSLGRLPVWHLLFHISPFHSLYERLL